MKQVINSILLISIALSSISCASMMKEGEKTPEQITSIVANESDPYLKENGRQEGIKVTGSGLQYLVLTEGVGPKPKSSDTVKVHYKGTLTDGKEFDSSYKRGEPISFPLSGVIKGWTEGLQLMNVGSKYRFFIPSRLAYGDPGIKDNLGNVMIPGGATLIFDVELLAFQ